MDARDAVMLEPGTKSCIVAQDSATSFSRWLLALVSRDTVRQPSARVGGHDNSGARV